MEQDFMKYEVCKPRDLRFIQMLVDEYNSSNISLKELSIKYHTDAHYQFKKYKISVRSKGYQRALTRNGCIELNWKGDCIKTEEQAYILGLLYADGYVSDTQMGLRLKKSDKDVVEKVKNYFSKDIKLQCFKNSYSFAVSSKEVCRNLQNLGMLKRKTQNILRVPKMQENLYRHFIRGFFDGDGTIYKDNKALSLRFNICSPTIEILTDIENIFQKNNIASRINKEVRTNKLSKVPSGKIVVQNLDMYRLFVRRKIDIEKLYHFLYDDCTIYMERKKKVFEDNTNLMVYKNPRKYMPIPS